MKHEFMHIHPDSCSYHMRDFTIILMPQHSKNDKGVKYLCKLETKIYSGVLIRIYENNLSIVRKVCSPGSSEERMCNSLCNHIGRYYCGDQPENFLNLIKSEAIISKFRL